MANYTYELNELITDGIQIFDPNFDFYTDDTTIREEFIDKFNNWYYYNEINSDEIERFQRQLNNKMKVIMPYYSQLYDTQTKALLKDFLSDRDLTDTYSENININDIIKDIINNDFNSTKNNKLTSTGTNTSNNTLTINQTRKNDNNVTTNNSLNSNTKISNIADGIADVSVLDHLTGEQSNVDTSENTVVSDLTQSDSGTNLNNTTGETNKNDTSNTTENGTNTTNSDKTRTNKTNITKTNTSKGNTGKDYSILLENWRKTIINIDKEIILELRDMFMLLF